MWARYWSKQHPQLWNMLSPAPKGIPTCCSPYITLGNINYVFFIQNSWDQSVPISGSSGFGSICTDIARCLRDGRQDETQNLFAFYIYCIHRAWGHLYIFFLKKWCYTLKLYFWRLGSWLEFESPALTLRAWHGCACTPVLCGTDRGFWELNDRPA